MRQCARSWLPIRFRSFWPANGIPVLLEQLKQDKPESRFAAIKGLGRRALGFYPMSRKVCPGLNFRAMFFMSSLVNRTTRRSR